MSWSPADVCSRLSSHCISLCPGTDALGGNVQCNLESQLHQIHSLVGEMRSKFRDTVDVLMKVSSSDNDTANSDHSHEQQLAKISTMILVMKNDLDRVVDQLHAATASQHSLQEQLEMIRTDRDSLLEELRHSGIGLKSNR